MTTPSTPPERFILTAAEKASGTWVRLLAHFQARLALLRAKNDGLQTEAETAALRGQIKELKGLIALNTDQPPFDG